MSADKAPVEKLPLAARKNVRDGWDSKKPELEAQLLTLLGVPWTFEINPNAIYPYAEPDSYGNHSPGDCIYAYAEAFVQQVKYFLDSHKEAGKTELNSVVPNHKVTLSASTAFSYCGTAITDGNLNLHFHPNSLASNISYVAQNLDDALSAAPQPEGASPLSYAARHSIKSDYESQILPILEKSRKALQNPALKFEPDFEALGAKLKTGKDVRDDWEKNLGSFAISYYESFADILQREKFDSDDLLREGFEEEAAKGVVRLRIVDKLGEGKGSNGYNEILIEDGEVLLRTTPDRWGTNISYVAEKLVEIL
jgi:hypothetical protein